MSELRAFQRQGFGRRAAPFVAATLLGLVVLLLSGPTRDPALLAETASFVLLVWGVAYVLPWPRLPAWADVVPPLLLLVPVAAIRRAFSGGIATQTAGPFFLIPAFWVALYGTGRQLAAVLAMAVVVRFAPMLRDAPEPGELGYAVAALIVTATACVLTNAVVRRARDAERSLRRVLDTLPVGFTVVADGRVEYANEKLAALVGAATPADLVGVEAASLLHEDERATLAERMAAVERGDAAAPIDRRLLHRGGGEVVVQVQHSGEIHFEDRVAIGIVVRDVTDERLLAAAEQAMHDRIALERAKLATILAEVRDGVAIVDANRRGVLANRAYLDLFGIDERAFPGMDRETFMRLTHDRLSRPDHLDAMLDPASNPLDEEGAEILFERPVRRIMRRTIRPIQLPDGPGYLVVWHDVTADRDLIVEREHQAMTDALTGAANRRAAELALAREIPRAHRSGSPLCIAMIDLDHFKQVNDRFGHDAGDRALAATAGALMAHARASDLIARWGGEEFVALLPTNLAGARVFSERVREAVATLAPADGVRLTISVGVAELRPDEDAAQVLRRADEMLYAAKQGGRDRVCA